MAKGYVAPLEEDKTDSLVVEDLLRQEESQPMASVDKKKPWFVLLEDDTQEGPFPFSVLVDRASSGQLTPDTYVWRQGMKDWLPIAEVAELSSVFDGSAEPKTLAPVLPIVDPAPPLTTASLLGPPPPVVATQPASLLSDLAPLTVADELPPQLEAEPQTDASTNAATMGVEDLEAFLFSDITNPRIPAPEISASRGFVSKPNVPAARLQEPTDEGNTVIVGSRSKEPQVERPGVWSLLPFWAWGAVGTALAAGLGVLIWAVAH
jgi:hypothetical protein